MHAGNFSVFPLISVALSLATLVGNKRDFRWFTWHYRQSINMQFPVTAMKCQGVPAFSVANSTSAACHVTAPLFRVAIKRRAS